MIWYGLWFLVFSILSYRQYAQDKRAARNGWSRTPESRLLLLDLAGGWPGGLYAQRKLRHKTRKAGYLVRFYLAVLANIVLTVWVFSPASMGLLG